MVNEDKHNVRVTFDHDNGISIDAKGCGQIYLKPNRDYFFENAPMKFINYLSQLRRLGITYKITNDKRGCYQTFNLVNYYANDPFHTLSKIRSNKTPIATVVENDVDLTSNKTEEITEENTSSKPEEVTPTTIIENIKEAKEQEINEDSESTNENSTEDTSTSINEDEKMNADEEVETIDVDSLSKPELIEYAKSLGLTDVTDYWTKKEIRDAIKSLSK